MNRIITTSALAIALAGPALAATEYTNNGVVPPREYQQDVVGQTIEPDARTVVKTDRVFDPKAAAVIDQENVNQYIFNDDGQRVEAGGNYKMEDARYR